MGKPKHFQFCFCRKFLPVSVSIFRFPPFSVFLPKHYFWLKQAVSAKKPYLGRSWPHISVKSQLPKQSFVAELMYVGWKSGGNFGFSWGPCFGVSAKNLFCLPTKSNTMFLGFCFNRYRDKFYLQSSLRKLKLPLWNHLIIWKSIAVILWQGCNGRKWRLSWRLCFEVHTKSASSVQGLPQRQFYAGGEWARAPVWIPSIACKYEYPKFGIYRPSKPPSSMRGSFGPTLRVNNFLFLGYTGYYAAVPLHLTKDYEGTKLLLESESAFLALPPPPLQKMCYNPFSGKLKSGIFLCMLCHSLQYIMQDFSGNVTLVYYTFPSP